MLIDSYQLSLLGCDNGTVSLYDSEKEHSINSWQKHKSDVKDVAFSYQNRHVALSVSEDRNVSLLACDNCDVIRTISLKNVMTLVLFRYSYVKIIA